jgi:hypothetical protein
MNGRRLVVAAVVALAVSGVTRAAAAAGSERAAAIFRQGQEAFAHKSYAAAAAAFEQAAELAPHPSAWLDAAEAWELDGSFARAAEDCDRALSLPDASEGHRHEAEARLARLTPKVATLDLRASRPGLVRLDGAAELRAPGKHRVAPGHHAIAVEGATTPAPISIDAKAGETAVIDLDPPAPRAAEPAPPARADDTPPAPPPEAHRGPPLATWVAFGVASAAGATALVTGAMTLSARTDFTNAPSIDARDRFYRVRTITDVAWGVAGAAAITGAVLWLTAPRPDGSGVGLTLAPGGVFVGGVTYF